MKELQFIQNVSAVHTGGEMGRIMSAHTGGEVGRILSTHTGGEMGSILSAHTGGEMGCILSAHTSGEIRKHSVCTHQWGDGTLSVCTHRWGDKDAFCPHTLVREIRIILSAHTSEVRMHSVRTHW